MARSGTVRSPCSCYGPVRRALTTVWTTILSGEWGPVYASPEDGEQWESINGVRYGVLKDQLALYEERKISWSIWLYKDIGFQGTQARSARFLNAVYSYGGFCHNRHGLRIA